MAETTSGVRVAASVVAITPFDRDGRLDEGGTRAHLRRLHDAGLGIWVGGGGSGEGFTLSDAEADRLLELAVDELGGSVRAMGVEPRTAAQMVAFTARAARAGVAACQVYSLEPGHGHRPTMAEVEAYFDDVLGPCPLPAVLSTHQSVGYRLPVGLVTALVERHPCVIGVNSSHPDVTYLAELVDALAGRVEICVGGPLQALTALGVGAHGFLSSEANLAPRLVASLDRHLAAGQLAEALAAFGTLVRLHHLLYANGGIRATKGVLRRLGLPGGFLRPPQQGPDGELTGRLLAEIRRLGVDAVEGWPPP